MKDTKGAFKLEYKGKKCDIEYSLRPQAYGGLAMMTIVDKYRYYHTFIRKSTGEWGSLGKQPSWPVDFFEMLYYVFEDAYQECIN